MGGEPIASEEVIAAFPEFEVDPEPLGVGGMKSAFRATANGEPVVLKIVREPLPDYDSEEAATFPVRIQREIEGMRRIHHPRIVTVLDGPSVRVIEGERRVWYLEPLYPGGTLKDRLTRPLLESEVLDLVSYLVEGVEVLSSAGIVHRDIKPGNIAFDDGDLPVLLDLGIALFTDLTAVTNEWARSPMTHVYAAPEQFDWKRDAAIDFRTDLFLIGVVAFEALTGVHPFDPGSNGYMERLLSGSIDADALDTAGASECMQRLLRRLLAPAQSQRYRRIDFLREEIEQCR